MQCPNCQHTQENEITCGSCGIYFEKWRRREEESKQVKTTIYTEPPPSQTFKIFGLGALAASLILFAMQKFGAEEKAGTPVAQAAPAPQATPAPAAAPPTEQSVASPQVVSTEAMAMLARQNISDQKAAARQMTAYQRELQNLRSQQFQVVRAIERTRQNYDRRYWSSRDDAQLHAYQVAQQEQEQELSTQLDGINSQIDLLMSHPPGSP